jgi:dienelactone hydrolase
MATRIRSTFLGAAFLVSCVACTSGGGTAPTPPAPTPTPIPPRVGYTVVTVTVPATGSTVPVAVWYPTDTLETTVVYGSGQSGSINGSAALNAPVKAGSWPLLVFAHGFSGGGIGSAEITEAVGRAGYVVACPDLSDAVMCVRTTGPASGTITQALDYLTAHPFNGTTTYDYRPKEFRGVLDALLGRKDLNIDAGKVAVGGHSLGGWTAMSAAAGDSRVKASVLYSMGELNWYYTGMRYFEAPFFQALGIPTIYFYGSKEQDMVAAAHTTPNGYGDWWPLTVSKFEYYYSPSPAYLLQVNGGNHFVYNSAAVANASAGTAQQFAAITASTTQFLDKHLKGLTVAVTADQSK